MTFRLQKPLSIHWKEQVAEYQRKVQQALYLRQLFAPRPTATCVDSGKRIFLVEELEESVDNSIPFAALTLVGGPVLHK